MADDQSRSERETAPSRTMLAGERIDNAWMQNNKELERDAISLWQKRDVLPEGTAPQERVKELVCVAYVDDVIAGLLTASTGRYEPLKHSLAFIRIHIEKEYRLNYLQIRLATRADEILRDWSIARPDLGLAGTARVRQAEFQRDRLTPAVSPTNRSVLVGYNKQGEQVRVKWFDHIRV